MRKSPKKSILTVLFDYIKAGKSAKELNDYTESIIAEKVLGYSDHFYNELHQRIKGTNIPEKLFKIEDDLHWFIQVILFLKTQRENLDIGITRLTVAYFYLKNINNNKVDFDYFREYVRNKIQPSEVNISIVEKILFGLNTNSASKNGGDSSVWRVFPNHTYDSTRGPSKYQILRDELGEAIENSNLDEVQLVIAKMSELKETEAYQGLFPNEKRDLMNILNNFNDIMYNFVTIPKNELYELKNRLDSHNYETIEKTLSDINKLEAKNQADEIHIEKLRNAAMVKLKNLRWRRKRKLDKDSGKTTNLQGRIHQKRIKYTPTYSKLPEIESMLAIYFEIAQERIMERKYGLPGTLEIPLPFSGYDNARISEVRGKYICDLIISGTPHKFDLYQKHVEDYALIQVYILVNISDIVKERETKIINFSNNKNRSVSLSVKNPKNEMHFPKYKHKYKTATKLKPKNKKSSNKAPRYKKTWHYRYYGTDFSCDGDALRRALIYTGVAYVPPGYTFVSPSPSDLDGEHLIIETELSKSFLQSLRSAGFTS